MCGPFRVFFFQAEHGIRDATVTGVQTCALPIFGLRREAVLIQEGHRFATETDTETLAHLIEDSPGATLEARVIAALGHVEGTYGVAVIAESGRAACRGGGRAAGGGRVRRTRVGR